MNKSSSVVIRCDPICQKKGMGFELTFSQLSALSPAQRSALLGALLLAEASTKSGEVLTLGLSALGVDVVAFASLWPRITLIPETMAAGLTLALQRAAANDLPIATVWKPNGEEGAFFVQIVELQGCILMELITPPTPPPVRSNFLSTFASAWVVGSAQQIEAIHDAIANELTFDDPFIATGVASVSSIQQRANGTQALQSSMHAGSSWVAQRAPKTKVEKAKPAKRKAPQKNKATKTKP